MPLGNPVRDARLLFFVVRWRVGLEECSSSLVIYLGSRPIAGGFKGGMVVKQKKKIPFLGGGGEVGWEQKSENIKTPGGVVGGGVGKFFGGLGPPFPPKKKKNKINNKKKKIEKQKKNPHPHKFIFLW